MLKDKEQWHGRLTKLRSHRCKAYSHLEAQSIRYGHWYAVIRAMLSAIV